MSFQGDSIFWVEVNKVVPNPFQPRREFDGAKLQELADSIRMYGILQPLTVTKKEIHSEDGSFRSEYELIAGERRLRASKLASLEQVPVIIRSGEDTEQEKLELAIIENLQREDLNAVDRAFAFKQLAEVFELSHAQVAKKVGRSREYVSNTIRLLMLPECMLSSLKVAEISEGHARSLLMLKERPEEQDVVYREILLKKLSVREVERISRKIASDKVRKKDWKNTDPVLIEIEREFTDTLGTRVQISKTDFGGKLTIDYFSDEDLSNLLHIVKSQGRMSQAIDTKDGEQRSPSEPVMQAGGAAVMAKLAQATPLEEVVEVAVEELVQNNHDNPEPVVRQASESQTVPDVTEEIVAEEKEVTIPSIETLQQNKSYFTKEPEPTIENVESYKAESQAPVSTPEETIEALDVIAESIAPQEEKPTEEDDELYSIRNFSL